MSTAPTRDQAMRWAERAVGPHECLAASTAETITEATDALRATAALAGCGADHWYEADKRGIVARGRREGPATTVKWREVAEVIRAGATEELVDELRAAIAGYCALAGAPHDFSNRRSDPEVDAACEAFYGRYRHWTERMAAAKAEIFRRGHGAAQLDMFGRRVSG